MSTKQGSSGTDVAGDIDPITGLDETIEVLERVADLYDEAALLLIGVAKGQQDLYEQGESLGIIGHLNAVADAHKKAKPLVLLAVVEMRKRVRKTKHESGV